MSKNGKKIWIELDSWEKNETASLIEAGIDVFVVKSRDMINNITVLARVTVYIKEHESDKFRYFTVNSREDEEEILNAPENMIKIVSSGNWKVIPFENLLARGKNIYAHVTDFRDAGVALEIMEKGVDGIYLSGVSSKDASEFCRKIKASGTKVPLSGGKIISVTPVAMGDRVCIDTITLMKPGQGMLVGDYTRGMVLVNSESRENPYVAPRPFRVNAGAVHCYILTSPEKTRYLSELNSGDEVLIVDKDGQTVNSVIGRIKQEKRPMVRIEVAGKKAPFSVILQNAETVRLVCPGGKTKSVVELIEGDEILIREEEGGRHLGHKIEETIEEK